MSQGADKQAVFRSILFYANLLFIAGLWLGSFDIFLTLDLGGITVRLGQLAQALVILLAASLLYLRGGRLLVPPGLLPLSAWGAFLIAWTPHTHHLLFSIAYTVYFVFSYFLILAAVQVYSGIGMRPVDSLYRAYLLSFVAVAGFGVVQFAAGLAGVHLLVEQWWIEGLIPRANGFSYEPSYYATYLMIGWGMFASHLVRGPWRDVSRVVLVGFALSTLAIFLSGSRIAIALLGGVGLLYLAARAVKSALRLRVRKASLLLGTGLVFTSFGAVVVLSGEFDVRTLSFLLGGTGLGGTASHSVSERAQSLRETIEVFRQSPIVGYGLGGVWSQIAFRTNMAPGEATGMNVTLESLAASGILGFPFFLAYFFWMVRICLPGAGDARTRGMLAACGVGLVLSLTLLQANQGIMRVYLWNHLAVISIIHCAARWHSRRGTAPETQALGRLSEAT